MIGIYKLVLPRPRFTVLIQKQQTACLVIDVYSKRGEVEAASLPGETRLNCKNRPVCKNEIQVQLGLFVPHAR